jgi:glutamine---fructose-6-phosphate transaminase (isomerizing)
VPTNDHFLFRELQDQPSVVRKIVDGERDELDRIARLLGRRRIHFLGMGSSYFASLYGNYLLAKLAHRTAQTHPASEFVHYPSAIPASEICVALSQSGESVETVKAVRLLKKKGNFVVGVTNEPKSPLARVSDRVVLMHAGKERASSTKTFAATLAILYCLVVGIAARGGEMDARTKDSHLEKILRMSRKLDISLDAWNNDARLQSRKFANSRAAIVLARGPNLSAALQGALLFKEVAKLPAEGMSSGEFAHGPVEVLSREIGLIVLGGGRTSGLQYRLALRSKSLQARTLMITSRALMNVDSIRYDGIDEYLAVFPCVMILELLAYHTALKKRLNPDQFRFIHKVTTRE